jgi:Initiator Replication protein
MATISSRQTFQKTLDAKPNDHSIVKPGELVDIVEMTPLTLSDRRIYNLLIANAWEHIGEATQHSIRKNELQNSLHKGTDRLDDSIRRLMSAIVEVRVMRERKWETKRVQLLGPNSVPDADDGFVRYDFQPLMREIINESRVFARLHKQIMFALSSKYSLALYELIQKRGNLTKNFEDLSITDLRNFLGVPSGKLSSWINLKNKAITPAVKEVSDLSEFVVSVEPVKGKARGFTDVRLSWQCKGLPELQQVERELSHSKVGRKARMAGTVEHVEFGEGVAALPSLRGDTLQKAKKLLPGYDVYHVEGEWRAWAQGKPAPGNADAAFLAFCKTFRENHPL